MPGYRVESDYAMHESQISWDEQRLRATINIDVPLGSEAEDDLRRIYGVQALHMLTPNRRSLVVAVEGHTLQQSVADAVLTYLFAHGYLQPGRWEGVDA
jgi:hypothetical protein